MSVVMESWLSRHRFNVDEYHRMREFGILKRTDRVELLEGHIFDLTDRLADEGIAVSSRESRAMEAEPDAWLPFHRFTVGEYYRMFEIGLLAPDARVELIEGEIIDMTPIGSLHCGTVDWITALFHRTVSQHALVRTQGVVALSGFSEPQPDIALLERRKDFYRKAHPGAPETFLIVEVSDSSLRTDQLVKIPLFAHFGVPEVWVVDLLNERLHFYRSPREGDYTDVSSTAEPGLTALSALPDIAVDLSELFGPPP
jgi:Uma2 family endonuclease